MEGATATQLRQQPPRPTEQLGILVTAGYAMSCDLQHGDEPYGATENNCKGSN